MMKTLRFIPLVAAALLSVSALTPPLQAEPTTPAAPAGGPPGDGPGAPGRPHRPRLTPEEMEKLKTVREQVFASNPALAQERDALKARFKAAQEKLHALMVAANPEVKPIVEKLGDAWKDEEPGKGNRPVLTPKERQLLEETREKVLAANPELKAEMRAIRDARMEFEKKVRDAMIAADPSVKEIFEKMRQGRPGGPDGPGRPHGPKPHGPKPGADKPEAPEPTALPSGT